MALWETRQVAFDIKYILDNDEVSIHCQFYLRISSSFWILVEFV